MDDRPVKIPNGRKLTPEQWKKRRAFLTAMEIASAALFRNDSEGVSLYASVLERWREFWRVMPRV
jgi:hypothetical protein